MDPHAGTTTQTRLFHYAHEHRIAMVNLTIEDNPNFELSRMDIDRPGPHYASDTIALIAKQNPKAELVPIMGGDSLKNLPTWHKPKEIVYACHWIGVMKRPNEEPDLEMLERELPGIRPKSIMWMDPVWKSSPVFCEVESHPGNQSKTIFLTKCTNTSINTDSMTRSHDLHRQMNLKQLPSRQIHIAEKLFLAEGDIFFSTMQTLTVSVNTVRIMGRTLLFHAR